MVVPRASLLWKPRPALMKYSVFAHGPSTTVAFGLTIESLALPELAGTLLSTSKSR